MFDAQPGLLIAGEVAEKTERHLIVRLAKPAPHDTVTVDIEPGMGQYVELGSKVVALVRKGAEDEFSMGVKIVD